MRCHAGVLKQKFIGDPRDNDGAAGAETECAAGRRIIDPLGTNRRGGESKRGRGARTGIDVNAGGAGIDKQAGEGLCVIGGGRAVHDEIAGGHDQPGIVDDVGDW